MVVADSPESTWQSIVRTRLFVIATVFVVWAVAVESRLVWLQVYQHDHFVTRAANQQKRTATVAPRRGDIVDRHGRPLAISVDADTIAAVPRDIDNPQATVDAVCAALQDCVPKEREVYLRRLLRTNGSIYLRRQITSEQAARVTALKLPGIGLVTETKRFYPNRELAAHVLGFVNVDNHGGGGIEAAYDSRISGLPGKILIETDGKRHAYRAMEQPPTAGATVELTLDAYLQHMVERELHAGIIASRAAAGTALMMNPRTGEILALANEPTFNPNAIRDAKQDHLRNRAVAEIYEPGSTFKVVTASAAIEEQMFRSNDPIDVSAGSIRIGSRVVNDDHRIAGELSFTDVIVKSSNVGAIKVGLTLGAERLGRYVRRFGFGAKLCPDVAGETPGRLSDPGQWTESTLASVSMGYEIGVSPLQMATAVSSVANGGLLIQPRIVRALRTGTGRREIEPNEMRRSINPDTSAELTTIMEQVVERGTGTKAQIPGYTIAGKTGTAGKVVKGGYSKTDYFASFVGFAPSREPAFTILVVIDSPHAGSIYGGTVAAPIFKRIAEAALRHLGIAPTLNPAPPVIVTASSGPGQVTRAVAAASVPVRSTGRDVVTGPPTVPDVRGLGAREAIVRLARLGLFARVTGDGVVIDQDPAAGAPLQPGAACRLWLDRVVMIPPPASIQP